MLFKMLLLVFQISRKSMVLIKLGWKQQILTKISKNHCPRDALAHAFLKASNLPSSTVTEQLTEMSITNQINKL